MDCESKLKKDFLFDCNNIPQAGLLKAVLVNTEDINIAETEASYDPINNVYKDFVLKTDTDIRGYLVEQKNDSLNGTKWEVVSGTFTNGTKHTFAFVAFDRSSKAKLNIDKILNGSFCALVMNKKSDETVKIEILGYDDPLVVPTGSQDYVAEDSAGNIILTLENKFSGRLPLSLFDTDLATTIAKFESLYAD